MKPGRFVFWQQFVSPHVTSWTRALADVLPAGNVVTVFENSLPPQRVALGWGKPDCGLDYGRTKVFISPQSEALDFLIHDHPETTTHIFSGMVHVPSINRTMHRCMKTGARVGLMTEARDFRGFRGTLRIAHSFFHERMYRDRVDFVLAIGRHACGWYRKCGFQPELLFPFCYSVEKPAPVINERTGCNRAALTFVGQLVPGKRLDLLLRALWGCRSGEWTLRIIGDGSERLQLEKLACELDLHRKVVFTGALSNSFVRKELANSDLFVLPSRWDGWGAVVNEALMSGTPVICSSFCGAADLIQNGLNGEVFQCDSVKSLMQALDKWISNGQLDGVKREQIRVWSRCIEGEEVARYFLEVVNYLGDSGGGRPRAPWLQ
jgi:glycosyltransferase involved in cell wall biosynthesis